MTEVRTRKLHDSALRAYDIRGGIGEILFIEDAYFIGRAFATKVIRKSLKKNPKIAIGYDGRTTSPQIKDEAIKGMVDAGANVINVGLGPSPLLYFAVREFGYDAGIMVTGSHNPSHHNGFKMMYDKSPLFDTEIKDLGRISEVGDFESNAGGTKIDKDIYQDYLKRILKDFTSVNLSSEHKEFAEQFKVVWDPGNGAAGELVERLIKELPGKHWVINGKIDGTFPSHHPDPTIAENLKQLIDYIKEKNANLGIAFDGDGDRIGAVDGKGRIIWGDQLMTIYAQDVLDDNPGAEIIADVKASQTFFDKVKELGGKPLMWKTGHSYIKNKLAETGAPLAGEMSGHIFFADKYYGFDDALYSAARLINFFVKQKQLASEIVNSLPESHASQEYRLRVKEEDKVRIVEEIKEKIRNNDKYQIDETDGIRVKDAQNKGWWLLRSSNTQSVITIRAESIEEDGLKNILSVIRELLNEYDIEGEI